MRVRAPAAILAATACGAALSVVLEAAQTFLPARVASNLDVLANTAGAFAGGVVGLLAAPWLAGKESLRHLRERTIIPGSEAELGLVLLGHAAFRATRTVRSGAFSPAPADATAAAHPAGAAGRRDLRRGSGGVTCTG